MIIVNDANIARYVLAGNHSKSQISHIQDIVAPEQKKEHGGDGGGTLGLAEEIVHSWIQSGFLKGFISTIVEKCNRFVVKCDEDAENDAV